jgi:hypothetical protein
MQFPYEENKLNFQKKRPGQICTYCIGKLVNSFAENLWMDISLFDCIDSFSKIMNKISADHRQTIDISIHFVC